MTRAIRVQTRAIRNETQTQQIDHKSRWRETAILHTKGRKQTTQGTTEIELKQHHQLKAK